MSEQRRQVVSVTRRELVAVMREGRRAGKAGVVATGCPYDPNGDADERLRVAAWMRGYVKGKRA